MIKTLIIVKQLSDELRYFYTIINDPNREVAVLALSSFEQEKAKNIYTSDRTRNYKIININCHWDAEVSFGIPAEGHVGLINVEAVLSAIDNIGWKLGINYDLSQVDEIYTYSPIENWIPEHQTIYVAALLAHGNNKPIYVVCDKNQVADFHYDMSKTQLLNKASALEEIYGLKGALCKEESFSKTMPEALLNLLLRNDPSYTSDPIKKEFYDPWDYCNSEFEQERLNKTIQAIRALNLDQYSNISISELGCGAGIFSRKLINSVPLRAFIDLVENSPNAFRLPLIQENMARVYKHFSGIKEYLKYYIKLITNLNIAILMEVLYYFNDQEQKEIIELLAEKFDYVITNHDPYTLGFSQNPNEQMYLNGFAPIYEDSVKGRSELEYEKFINYKNKTEIKVWKNYGKS